MKGGNGVEMLFLFPGMLKHQDMVAALQLQQSMTPVSAGYVIPDNEEGFIVCGGSTYLGIACREADAGLLRNMLSGKGELADGKVHSRASVADILGSPVSAVVNGLEARSGIRVRVDHSRRSSSVLTVASEM